MLRFAALLLSAAACLASPPAWRLKNKVSVLDSKIVGGADADIEDYPYQLSLESAGSHVCGASILTETWALTTASCTGPDPGSMALRAGSAILGNYGSVHQVAAVFDHELHDASTNDYDLALLKVATPFVFGRGVAAINLPPQGQETAAGTNSTITGWGKTSVDGFISAVLQVATVPVTSHATCQSDYPVSTITDQMICAGREEGGVDTCQGDVGGPMVVDDVVVGVVSWGRSCGQPRSPRVFAKVSAMRDWIDSTMAANP